MKTGSHSFYGNIHPRSRFNNRFKCRILAAIDLIWRLGEFLYAVLITFLPNVLNSEDSSSLSMLSSAGLSTGSSSDDSTSYLKNIDGPLANAQRGGSKFLLLLGGGVEDKTEYHYEIMDTRVYNFLLNPVLTFCYFIGFFLQISISFFLFCETSSYGKSASHQNEIAACAIWSRIAVISLIILCLRFFLPYALITYTNIIYTVSRVIFKVLGIILVIIHGRELKSTFFDNDLEDSTKNRLEEEHEEESEFTSDTPYQQSFNQNNKRFSYSNQSTKSVFVEVEFPAKKSTTTNKFKTFNTTEYELAKVHLVQVLAYIEKEMYTEALAELKIAQDCNKGNPHLTTMEPTIQRMLNLTEGGKLKDFYAILGVPKFSSMEAVKTAYRRKSLRHHPDKHLTEGEQIRKVEESRYLQVREAYETLSDPSKRTYYDEKLKTTKNRLTDLQKVVKTMYDLFNTSIPS